jgi:hypothetical protein
MNAKIHDVKDRRTNGAIIGRLTSTINFAIDGADDFWAHAMHWLLLPLIPAWIFSVTSAFVGALNVQFSLRRWWWSIPLYTAFCLPLLLVGVVGLIALCVFGILGFNVR